VSFAGSAYSGQLETYSLESADRALVMGADVACSHRGRPRQCLVVPFLSFRHP
jgi:hypothetical protein